MKKILLLIYLGLTAMSASFAQIRIAGQVENFELDYSKPKDFEIGGITVSGVKFLDNSALIKLTGIAVGDKIQVPGDKMSGAIHKLWKQGLFDDVQINVARVEGNLIFFDIVLKERARLSRFSFSGIKKSEADEIREKIKIL